MYNPFTILILFCAIGNAICIFSYIKMKQIQMSDEVKGLLPPAGENIPGTDHSFRRVWDYLSMKWGDTMGLPWMWGTSLYAIYVATITEGNNQLWIHLISISAGIIAVGTFHWTCMRPGRKGEWNSASVWISYGHYIHLIFMGASVWVGLAGLLSWSLHQNAPGFQTHVNILLITLWLSGVGIWTITVALDIRVGHFPRLTHK